MFKIYFSLITILLTVFLNQPVNAYLDRFDHLNQIKNKFCNELNDNTYLKQDAMEFCITRLAYVIQNLNDKLSNNIPAQRYLFKRPDSKPMDDEIKRNTIDSLHGLTLG